MSASHLLHLHRPAAGQTAAPAEMVQPLHPLKLPELTAEFSQLQQQQHKAQDMDLCTNELMKMGGRVGNAGADSLYMYREGGANLQDAAQKATGEGAMAMGATAREVERTMEAAGVTAGEGAMGFGMEAAQGQILLEEIVAGRSRGGRGGTAGITVTSLEEADYNEEGEEDEELEEERGAAVPADTQPTINSGGGSINSSSRWPRQEAVALLAIRSSMDTSFRDSTIKTPLWEQISRKMAEMGYKRTAKKCKEKFENMHKYYKRTKEGKTRKQTDGKHYRFFEQLEALTAAKLKRAVITELTIGDFGGPSSAAASTAILASATVATTTPALPPPPHISEHSNSRNDDIFFVQKKTAESATDGRRKSASLGGVLLHQHHPLTKKKNDNNKEAEETKKTVAIKKKYVEFFERAMKEVMRRQEEMQERFLEALERMELARAEREEEWRKHELARLSAEQDLRLHDTFLGASRDTSLIALLHTLVNSAGAGGAAVPDHPPPPAAATEEEERREDDDETEQLQHSSLLSASFAANSATLSSELISILQQQINLFGAGVGFGGGSGAAAFIQSDSSQYKNHHQKAIPDHLAMAGAADCRESSLEQAIIPFNNNDNSNKLMTIVKPALPAAVAADNNNNKGGRGDDDDSMMTDDTNCQEDKNRRSSASDGGGGVIGSSRRWPKQEVVALIKIRSGLDRRFRQPGSKAALWDEVSEEMRSLGYDRPPKRCKEKWENINKYFKKAKHSNKSRPQDAKTCPYFHHLNALYKKSILSAPPPAAAAAAATIGAAVISSPDDEGGAISTPHDNKPDANGHAPAAAASAIANPAGTTDHHRANVDGTTLTTNPMAKDSGTNYSTDAIRDLGTNADGKVHSAILTTSSPAATSPLASAITSSIVIPTDAAANTGAILAAADHERSIGGAVVSTESHSTAAANAIHPHPTVEMAADVTVGPAAPIIANASTGTMDGPPLASAAHADETLAPAAAEWHRRIHEADQVSAMEYDSAASAAGFVGALQAEETAAAESAVRSSGCTVDSEIRADDGHDEKVGLMSTSEVAREVGNEGISDGDGQQQSYPLCGGGEDDDDDGEYDGRGSMEAGSALDILAAAYARGS